MWGLRPRCRQEEDGVGPVTGSGVPLGSFLSTAAPTPGLWPLPGCARPSGRPFLSPSKPCRQPDTCRQHLNCPVRQFGWGTPSVGRHGLNFKEFCNVYCGARSDRIILVSLERRLGGAPNSALVYKPQGHPGLWDSPNAALFSQAGKAANSASMAPDSSSTARLGQGVGWRLS